MKECTKKNEGRECKGKKKEVNQIQTHISRNHKILAHGIEGWSRKKEGNQKENLQKKRDIKSVAKWIEIKKLIYNKLRWNEKAAKKRVVKWSRENKTLYEWIRNRYQD